MKRVRVNIKLIVLGQKEPNGSKFSVHALFAVGSERTLTSERRRRRVVFFVRCHDDDDIAVNTLIMVVLLGIFGLSIASCAWCTTVLGSRHLQCSVAMNDTVTCVWWQVVVVVAAAVLVIRRAVCRCGASRWCSMLEEEQLFMILMSSLCVVH